jgi:outer membrane protein OmpA-like peptidoglycan-associated protein
MRLRSLIFFFCLFSFVVAAAQSRKSDRAYDAAMRYEAAKKEDKAIKKLIYAIKKSPRSPAAYSQLGQWYFTEHRFTQAAAVFRNAAAKCKNGRQQFARPFAKSLLYSGMPDSALQLINTYSDHNENGDWEKMRRQAMFIKRAYIQQIPIGPVNLGERVNSEYPELYPSIVADTAALYFTRRVNNMDDDLYLANPDTCGGWFYALNMGDPPNTPDQESAQFISDDGHYLFFTRCENRSEDGWAEGGCDLFIAYRINKDSSWTIGQPFGPTINTTDYEGQPSLSPDNRELYFVSDRPGGYGGYDIWISRFENGLWQKPVNAGPGVNTAGNETAPFIGMDNKTLYFTSDGWPGMGGTDLYVSKRNKSTPATTFNTEGEDGSTLVSADTRTTDWGNAINLGYPINTANDEQSECVTADGSKIYFASDRNGPAGNFDLFSSALPGGLQPQATSTIDGYVYDSISKSTLSNAMIFVSNAYTGDTLYQFQSNRGDGSYTMVLPAGPAYAIHTNRIEFKEKDDTIVFDRQYLHQPLQYNIVMLPSDYVKPPNDSLVALLHFDVNRAELSDADKAEVKKALSPWLQQEGVTIYINGYTDNTGSPMLNEELSYKRAGIVAKEVLHLGFSTDAVQSKGWGEAKMIAGNDTEEGQRQNRRVEIIVRY